MAKEAYRIDISVAVDDRSEPALSKIEGKVSKLDKSVERTRKQLERMNRTRWQMAVHIADRASDVLVAINARVQSISGKTFRFTVRVLDYASRPLRMIGRLVSGGMALLGPALGAAASGLAGLFQTAAKFEQSMANLRMVTHANAQDFAALNQRARELGTSMPFTATQVADAMGSLAGAGFTAKQVLAGIGPALLLASAGQMDLAEAANLASGVLFGMRMPAAQLERVVDVMAKTAATANTSISQLGSAFSLAAPAAADANIAIEQMSAAIGALSSHGIQGERAGKAMRLMLMQLNDTSSPAAKKLKAMGLELWDAQHAFKGLTPFMAEVERKGLRLADVAHAFGTETADAASILLNMGSESFASYVKQLEQAEGAAEKMSKIQEDTLLGSIRRLSGAWEGIAISIGMQAVPALRAWIDRIAEAFTQSNGLADMIGGKINHVFTKLLDIMDSDAWNNAGVFGKIRLLWDEIVVAPFNEWWSGGGRERVIEAAHKIGAALGGALGGYLMGVLGMASKDADVDASPFVQAGSTAGRAFLEAFLEAFDAGKIVGKAIEAFKNVQPTWLGGDTSSPLGQTLALMMDAWIVSKTVQFLGKGKKFYKNARKWIGGGSSATIAETTATAATRTARAGTSKRSPWYRRWLRGSAAADAMPGPAAQFPADYRPAGKRYWRTIPLDRTYRRDEVVRMANAGQLGRYSDLEKAFGGQPGPAAQFPRNYRPAGKRYWRSIPLDRTYSRDDVVRMANAGQLGRYNELGKASRGLVPTPKTSWMPKWFQGGNGKGLGFLARTGGRVKLPFSFLLDAVNIAAAEPGEERNQAIGGTIGGWGGFAAGSAAGAAIGSVIPGVGTVIGGTVGGIIGSLGGGALGEWIGKEWENLVSWFDSSVWSPLKEGAAAAGQWLTDQWGEAKTWITNQWNGISDWFGSNVWTPLKDAGINTINFTVGLWDMGKETVKSIWDPVASWFDETVWLPIKEGAAIAGQWFSDTWDESKSWITEQWAEISGWFDETVWTPLKEGADIAGQWFSTHWGDTKEQLKSTWSDVSGWFGTNIWDPIKTGAENASGWIQDRFGEAKNWVQNVWSDLTNWFDQNVAQPVSDWVGDVRDRGSEITGLHTSDHHGVKAYAYGGFITRPHIGLVGEAGPEMIVPLSPGKRARGLSLWQQAGYMLGVQPYAVGGLAGGPQMSISAPAMNESSGTATASSSKSLGGIHLGGVTLNFTLEGSSENLLDSLRRNGEEIADYIGGVIAQKIEDASQNRV